MKIINRKFHRDYREIEKYEAGIVLTGAEVKSIRAGGLRIDDAFVRIMGSEVYLINAEISSQVPLPVLKHATKCAIDLGYFEGF